MPIFQQGLVYPGPSNAYIPTVSSSGNLIVSFSRNPKDFKFNHYVQLQHTQLPTGVYQYLSSENAFRVYGGGRMDYVWADGTSRPEGNGNLDNFLFKPFHTIRSSYDWNIGDITASTASWNIVEQAKQFAANRAALFRAKECIECVQNASNYDASHIIDVSNTSGLGAWGSATTSNMYIKKTLNTAQKLIQRDTFGNVKPEDLVLVIGVELAEQMSVSQEFVDFLKQSQYAAPFIQGTQPQWNLQFNIPNQLYGLKVVVDDTIINNARKNSPANPTYAFNGNTAVLCARPGSLVGQFGGRSFSSFVTFIRSEMVSVYKYDEWNKRMKGAIEEDFCVHCVAPSSAVLLTNMLVA